MNRILLNMIVRKALLFISILLYFSVFQICFAKVTPTMELDLDLKKDEVVRATINASKDSQSTSASKHFTLRWTLYRNEGLVVLVRYDKYPYQFVLYKDYRLNSWTLNLLDPQGINRDPNQPRLHITFIGIDDPFNDEKTIAHLRLYGFGDMDFTRE